MISIDLDTGDKTIISENSISNAENTFADPADLILDEEKNRVYVVDNNLDALIRIDLTAALEKLFQLIMV